MPNINNQNALNATNLFQYYQALGQNLPSLSQRAPLYQQYGGTGAYTGTAQQNVFLLGKLKQGLPQAQPPQGADNIQNLPSPQLPQAQPQLGDISQSLGGGAMIGSQTDSNIANLNQQLAQFETQRQGLISQFLGQQGQQISRAELRTQLEEQYKIKAQMAEIDKLSSEYNLKKSAMETEINRSSERLASTGFISREQSTIERKYAPTLNRMSADINFKTGLLTKSEDLMNTAIQDAVADQQFRVNQAKMFLEANLDAIDRMESIYKTTYKEYVNQQEKELDRQYKEKQLVVDWAIDNPDAGIAIGDTYESAAEKIVRAGGSLAARRERRLSIGGEEPSAEPPTGIVNPFSGGMIQTIPTIKKRRGIDILRQEGFRGLVGAIRGLFR